MGNIFDHFAFENVLVNAVDSDEAGEPNEKGLTRYSSKADEVVVKQEAKNDFC